MKNLPTHQTLGAYRRKIGDLVLTTLSDGYLDVSFDLLSNIAPEEIDQILEAAAVPKRARATIQSYLIQSSTKTVLIDGGAGGMNGWGGELQNSLASVGVAKSDIDLVLLTHGHPDHLGGLATENGEPVFPNAELALSKAELAFWTDDAIINAAPEGFRPFFLAARKVFDAYDDRLRMLDSERRRPPALRPLRCQGIHRDIQALPSNRGAISSLFGVTSCTFSILRSLDRTSRLPSTLTRVCRPKRASGPSTCLLRRIP
ncbi:MBL fold metallo-hydrolase [Rhizobium sp. BR 315]|uniref:MBL fold metallo-hydrolase n=1 Tax=Rhizobium sp. BR 315 TaxID=3040014 RepID=UPI003D334E3A